jgi:hypothetical protein
VTRSRAGLLAALVVAVVATVAVAALLLRPTATAVTGDGVAVECTGVDPATCAAWAESVLADGPGIHTFDPEDLERVRLGRSILGLFGDCQAEYLIGRYDDVAARETVTCPAG